MDASPSSQPCPLLAAGDLVLDVRGWMLRGPAGEHGLAIGAFAVLRSLMMEPGCVVATSRLIEQRWCTDLKPVHAETAIRMCVSRARDAIEMVGVDPKLLRTVSGIGYRLDGGARVVRSYTLHQAALLDRLIATHPDASVTAELTNARASTVAVMQGDRTAPLECRLVEALIQGAASETWRLNARRSYR